MIFIKAAVIVVIDTVFTVIFSVRAFCNAVLITKMFSAVIADVGNLIITGTAVTDRTVGNGIKKSSWKNLTTFMACISAAAAEEFTVMLKGIVDVDKLTAGVAVNKTVVKIVVGHGDFENDFSVDFFIA